MERLFITAVFTIMSSLLGLIIVLFSFASAWMTGETPGFWFVMLFVSAASYFLIPWFFTGIDDRWWYLYSLAVTLPGLIMYLDIIIGNFERGHFPVVIAAPLIVTVLASFGGGYLKKRRIRVNPPTCE